MVNKLGSTIPSVSLLVLVKDFLKSKGFKSTLDCLEKEESSKSDKKKVSIILITFFFNFIGSI